MTPSDNLLSDFALAVARAVRSGGRPRLAHRTGSQQPGTAQILGGGGSGSCSALVELGWRVGFGESLVEPDAPRLDAPAPADDGDLAAGDQMADAAAVLRVEPSPYMYRLMPATPTSRSRDMAHSRGCRSG